MGGEIDDLRARGAGAAHPGRRGAVRQRAEDEGAPVEMRIVVRDEPHLLSTEARALALSLVGRGEMEGESGMVRDEGAQLAAGIAGRPEHPDGKFMHRE